MYSYAPSAEACTPLSAPLYYHPEVQSVLPSNGHILLDTFSAHSEVVVRRDMDARSPSRTDNQIANIVDVGVGFGPGPVVVGGFTDAGERIFETSYILDAVPDVTAPEAFNAKMIRSGSPARMGISLGLDTCDFGENMVVEVEVPADDMGLLSLHIVNEEGGVLSSSPASQVVAGDTVALTAEVSGEPGCVVVVATDLGGNQTSSNLTCAPSGCSCDTSADSKGALWMVGLVAMCVWRRGRQGR